MSAMQRINRRTSFGSTSSLRRSSVSAKDILAIQLAMQRQQIFSSNVLVVAIILLPLVSFFYLHAVVVHRGAFLSALSAFFQWPWILSILPPLEICALKFILCFGCIQIILHHILPHDQALVLSSNGDYSVQINGLSSFLVLILLYMLGSAFGLYAPNFVLLHFNSIIFWNAVFCVGLLAVLLVTYRFGDYYNVTTIPELFFGVESHPMFLDMDLKHMLRTRIALPLSALCAVGALQQQFAVLGKCSNDLLALTIIELAYITRRLWQENLELNNIDALKNNLGLFRIWTDMICIPIIFFSPVAIISQKMNSLNIVLCSILAVMGVTSVLLTGLIDGQKYEFRKAKGDLKIRGVDAFFITAKYKTESGESASNLLLGSGYWSHVRHPNYLVEIFVFVSMFLLQGRVPYFAHFPLLYTTCYIITRMYFDEQRCLVKYGQNWIQHCTRVPFIMIPGLY